MRRPFIHFLALSLLLSLPSMVTSNSEFIATDATFALTLPDGWRLMSEADRYHRFAGEINETVAPSLHVVLDEPLNPLYLEDAVRMVEDSTRFSDKGLMLMQDMQDRLGGEEAWRFEFSYRESGQVMKRLQWVTVHRDRVYHMYLDVPDEWYWNNRHVVDLFVTSFRCL
ncbi:hypothetical protein GF324_08120 [bacterium]|nr:hypothetical protein [bacterium]